MKLIDTKNAAGTVLCHDITQIVRGGIKDARFRKGHIVTAEDIPVLLRLGKEHLYVWEQKEGMLHENEAAIRLLGVCKNARMKESDVKEGKIELSAEEDGLFIVNSDALIQINSIKDIAIATRHGNSSVKKGDKLAGFRVIPLAIDESYLIESERIANGQPILELVEWRLKTAAVITTGSEVFHGLIQDTFTPVVIQKLEAFGITVSFHEVCDDNTASIAAALSKAQDAGTDIILCTGGMSVDADDRTPGAILHSGAKIVSYGAPVLPGAMFLIAYLPLGPSSIAEETGAWNERAPANATPVLGLPGCVMHAPFTIFDIILPRIAAGLRIRKKDIVSLGEGGLCLNCPVCSFPLCAFGK